MLVQNLQATRALPVSPAVAAGSEMSIQNAGMQPDHYQYRRPTPPPIRRGGGDLFDFLGGLLRLVNIGFGSPSYPYPQPYPQPGNYGLIMSSVINDYARRRQQLYAGAPYMPPTEFDFREHQLWQETCEQIVRSWSSPAEKQRALWQVLNSSSMQRDDYGYYESRIGGYYR